VNRSGRRRVDAASPKKGLCVTKDYGGPNASARGRGSRFVGSHGSRKRGPLATPEYESWGLEGCDLRAGKKREGWTITPPFFIKENSRRGTKAEGPKEEAPKVTEAQMSTAEAVRR